MGTVCALLALHAGLFKATGGDFGAFHLAGERALTAQPLYFADEANPFKYSPAAAMLFAPLGALPVTVARVLWAVLSGIAAWVFLREVSHAVVLSSAAQSRHAVVLVLVAPYLFHHFALGQCDTVLLAAMAVSERDAERAPCRSGMLWALACVFKLPFLIFLLPVLLLRQWRRLAACVTTLGVAWVAQAVWFGGVSQLNGWLRVHEITTPPLLCSGQNQSVFALACTLENATVPMPFGVLTLAWGVVGTLALAVALTWRRDDKKGRVIVLASAFWLTAFFSPLGWWTNLIALAPALYALVELAKSHPSPWGRRVAWAVLGCVGIIGWLNFDTLGRERFEVFLHWRHFALGGLVAVQTMAWLTVTELHLHD